ncbi:MAG TPA: NUDIX hydrolase, partial [Thermomonas sp.]|nr:NUDIX hydrolase [Thermomonas sp.]
MSYREGRFWQPDVTVATIVVRDGQLLMVEERANGALVLNQPAGHLEPDESLLDAALRETREETGWEVRLTAFVGAYQWKAPLQADGSGGRHYLRFAFAAEPVRELPDARLDEGIVRALWLTPEALRGMASRHRSPLVWRAVADYLGG